MTEPDDTDTDTDTDGEQSMSGGLELHKPLDDMTNAELRGKIAYKTGHRPPKHGLNKDILNSVHAWFTGEFHTHKQFMEQGIPPKHELVEDTVLEALNRLYDFPTDDPTDAEDPPVGPLVDYYRIARDTTDEDDPVRAMNKDELQRFAEAMITSGDQRRWTK